MYREKENDADASHEDGGPGTIDREAYHKDFQTLELSIDASPEEVTDAYRRLKEAYSPELVSMSSPVGYAIEKKRRQDMIGQIEAAYRSLQRLFEKEAPVRSEEIAAREDESPPGEAVQPDAVETGPVAGAPVAEAAAETDAIPREETPEGAVETEISYGEAIPEEVAPETAPDPTLKEPETEERPLADIADFSGQTLKDIREKLKVSLEEVYEETKIRIPTLQNLETENFPDLPPEVYVKGFVKSYARRLSLDPVATARIYMEKYHEWQRRKGGKKHRQQHHAPFRFSKKKGGKGQLAL